MRPSSTATDPRAAEVLRFWFRGAARRSEWFAKDPAFDADIRARFLPTYEAAASGAFARWRERPGECLALVLVLDQFPRHLFRASARAYATDAPARAAAAHAIAQGWDRAMLPVERLFLYLPFEHSEALADQDRALALIGELASFPETADALRWAEKHRAVIRRFGRFPHRNEALGRTSTAEECAFLRQPGSRF
jgi:uncharacterized protein (DUF924 family)